MVKPDISKGKRFRERKRGSRDNLRERGKQQEIETEPCPARASGHHALWPTCGIGGPGRLSEGPCSGRRAEAG